MSFNYLSSFVNIFNKRAKSNKGKTNTAIEETIDNKNVQTKDPLHSSQSKNKADVLTFDAKTRLFIVKKRRCTVALYDPENYKVHLSKIGKKIQTLQLDENINNDCLPLSGDWYHPGQSELGLYSPETSDFFLYNTQENTIQTVNLNLYNQHNALKPIRGDWMGSGKQSIGLFDRKNSTFLIKLKAKDTAVDKIFSFGLPQWESIPLIGDWNGDGKDSIGLYLAEQGLFFLHNSLDECLKADISLYFGPKNETMIPLVGDWSGVGKETIGLYSAEQGLFFLHNNNEGKDAIDYAFYFGPKKAGLVPLVGDWNGMRQTGVGVYDPESLTFYLTHCLSGSTVEQQFDFSVITRQSGIPFVTSYVE